MPSGVAGPLVCFPSTSWLALMTESSVMLDVVDAVVVAEIAMVDVSVKVIYVGEVDLDAEATDEAPRAELGVMKASRCRH